MQINRVLKQGGIAVIADLKKKDTGFGPPLAVRLSKQQAMDLFEKRSFTALQKRELKYITIC